MARPLTITAVSNAQVDTAEKISGTGSVLLANDGVSYTSWSYLEISQPNYELSALGDFTVEAWAYLDVGSGYNTDHAIFGTDATLGQTSSWLFQILHNSANNAHLSFSIGGQGIVVLDYDAALLRDQWVHYAVVKSGTTLKLYIDGVAVGTNSSFTGTLEAKTASAARDVYIGNYVSASGINQYGWFGWIDEARISNTARYTSDFTPATRFVPDNSTLLLVHMDGADTSTTFTDDIGVQGSANLTTAFQVTSGRVDDPSIVFLGNDVYTWDDTNDWSLIYAGADRWRAPERQFATFTQTAVGTRAIFGDAELASSFAQTAQALNLKSGSATLDSQFAVTATGERLPQGSATLDSQFAVTATGERLPQGAAQLAVNTNVTADGRVTIIGQSQMSVATEMSVTGRILKLANIDITPFATITADANILVDGRADFAVQTDQTARGGLLINIDDPIDQTWDTIDPDTWQGFVKDIWDPRGFFAFNDIQLTATAGIIQLADAQLASQFAVTASGLRLVNASTGLDNEFAVTATARKFVGGAAQLDTPFDFTVTALNLDIASANFTVSFLLTVDVGRIVQGEIVIDDFFNFSATVQNLKLASAELISRFDLTAEPSLIPNIILDRIESQFGVTVVGSVIVDGRAELAALATQMTVGQRLPGGSANLTITTNVTAEAAITVDGRAELSAFATQISAGRISNVRGSSTLSMSFGTVFEGDLRLLESDYIYKVLPELRSIGRPLVNYRSARTITARGGAALTSVQAKFGSGSVSITNIGDLITVSGTSDLYSGDFTAEMWIWNSNLTQMPNGVLWDIRTSASSGLYVYVSYGSIGLYEGITGKGLTSAGFVNSQWNHIAIVRNSNNLKIFVNGVQKISATVTTTNYSSRTTYVGGTYNNSIPLRGYIDELRLSNTARYTTAFTAPISPFSNDQYVRALVHFDGSLEDDIKIRSTVKTDTEIKKETNTYEVLSETSLWQVLSQSRQFDILPESRVLELD